MPYYRYLAKNAEGETRRGRLEASDRASLSEALRKEGMFLLRCREEREQKKKMRRLKKLSPATLAEFARQLSALLATGLSEPQAIETIAARDGTGALCKACTTTAAGLSEGLTLQQAMHRSGAFSKEVIAIFRAPAAEAAKRTQIYYEQEFYLRGRLRAAFFHPCILLGLAVATLFLILGGILPGFFALFSAEELPWFTAILASLSDLLQQHWPVVLPAVLLCAIAMGVLFCVPLFGRYTQKIALYLPGVGKKLRTVETGRFARALALFRASGLSEKEALYLGAGAIKNRYLSAQAERANASEGLEYAISTIKGLDSKFTALLQYGTRNGELEHVLEEAATLCGEDAEHAADKLCTVFEPLILGFAALLILLFLLAVLLPVFGIL